MRLASLFAAACVVAPPFAAAAETVVPVDKFTAVEVHGGGRVIVRPGPVQRVRLVRGDPEVASFRVDRDERGGRLIISPCRGFCFGSHRLEVEIETPSLNGATVMGGGHVRAQGAFPAQGAVSAVVHGGGDIDLLGVPAQSATATVHGGGRIVLSAQNSLTADVHGGGHIRYAGHPTVSSAIHGGGSVAHID